MAVMWWMPSSFTVTPSLLRAQQYSARNVRPQARLGSATMRKALTLAYHWLALLIAVGIVVQVFLAGLGIFGADSFEAHETFGGILHGLTILVFLLAIAGRRPGRTIGMGFGLAALGAVQISLVGARDDAPGLAAFHPVLALFALGLAFHMGMPAISRGRGASAPRPAR